MKPPKPSTITRIDHTQVADRIIGLFNQTPALDECTLKLRVQAYLDAYARSKPPKDATEEDLTEAEHVLSRLLLYSKYGPKSNNDLYEQDKEYLARVLANVPSPE